MFTKYNFQLIGKKVGLTKKYIQLTKISYLLTNHAIYLTIKVMFDFLDDFSSVLATLDHFVAKVIVVGVFARSLSNFAGV